MFEKFLIEMGLSEKEASIYMALLQSDFMGVADISKETKINRTTVYPVLEYLMSKGLVQEIEIKGKTKFKAESPERLESYIYQQKDQLREIEGKLQDMIPQFKSVMHRNGDRPIVELYEGKESILKAVRGITKNQNSEDEIYNIYSRDLVEKHFDPKDLKPLKKDRVQKNITSNVIYAYSKGIYKSQAGNRFKVNGKDYPIDAEINVRGDIINIFTMGESLNSIFIKNKDAATTLRTLFKLAFNSLKKDDK